jgi:hypothetical protein
LTPLDTRQRRRATIAAAAIIALVTLLQLPALISPFSGGFHDDGVYLVTARALAEGDGYRIQSLPDGLAQTKYPPVFPALLAVVWKIYPAFPDNLPLLRLVPFLAMWIWLWLVWKVAAQELGRKEDAAWAIGLTLASPLTLYLGTQLLSETLFAAIATWGVLVMVRIDRSTTFNGVRGALILAGICALAFHTRTIGISLAVPATWVLWRGGGFRTASAFGLAFVALCLPWLVWQAMHTAPPDLVLMYYTKANYGGWNLLTGGGAHLVGQVVAYNVLYVLAAPSLLWSLPPVLRLPLLYLAFLVLGAVGTCRMLRGRGAAVALWIAATIGILLLWTWPPGRFLVPVLPFLVLALLQGVLVRRSGVVWGVRAVLLVLLLSGGVQSIRLAAAVVRNGALPTYVGTSAAATDELMNAMAWVRANTPPDAVIAANLDANYWLYAERKAVRAFADDPVRMFYSPAAPIGSLGDAHALRELLGAHQVDYVVFEDLPIFRQTEPLRLQIADFTDLWPGELREAWTSGGGNVIVYEVRL